MRVASWFMIAALALTTATSASAQSPLACTSAGPQTPRDITSGQGSNAQKFALAPSADALNLCNIHFHVNAEHKGPGFSISAGTGDHGGWKCNETPGLTAAELTVPSAGACAGLKPGDTVEVHWVHSSCNVKPGKGLGSCLAAGCDDPMLRVETQVFLAVNDPNALDFAKFDYAGVSASGRHQARGLPNGTGVPVVFRGSTTGPSFNSSDKCSPLKVTWSVRPSCAKIDINTLHKWCERNAFGEDHGHGVRQIVTQPRLLDAIE